MAALVSNGALLFQSGTTTVRGMTAAALATTAGDQTEAIDATPKRIPKRIRHACELIASGAVTTITAAAERAKLSREHLSRMLSRPHVQVFVAQESRRNIQQATLRASRRMVELIDAKSEHVGAQVSERILTSEGILKSDQRAIAVNVDVRAGFVLDLREEAPALMPQQPLIDAKPLIDQGSRSSSGAADEE